MGFVTIIRESQPNMEERMVLPTIVGIGWVASSVQSPQRGGLETNLARYIFSLVFRIYSLKKGNKMLENITTRDNHIQHIHIQNALVCSLMTSIGAVLGLIVGMVF